MGSATTAGAQCTANVSTYQLTPDAGAQGGEIWYTTQVNLKNRFDITFQMFLGTQPYSVGADGICFVFQQQSTSAGSTGGGLGYGGITPSVAVEFDTYQNGWDPPFCHTAIEKNGDVNHTDGSGNQLAAPVQLDPANPNLPDGNWHNMEIIWDPTTTTISVYYDCQLRITYTGDIVNDPTIFNGNPNVYWGFTAGTGGAMNLQEVCITKSYLNDLRDTLVCNGSPVTYTATGGTSYSWAPAAGLNNTNSASVIATPTATTTYTVSITNSCGLVSTESATVRVSNTVLTPSSTTSTCGNPNGTASVTAASGISPYTYLWTGGQTTTTATGLAQGGYTVTSTDSLGCKATATTIVGGTPALRDSISAFTNVSVACGANGTATVGAKGGGGTYTYSWNTTPVQTNAMATNLGAGSYTVTVNDNTSCTATATVSITQPGALTASISGTTPVSCFGGSNGTATATITGGNSPYSYSWNNGITGAKDSMLSAGNYTVSVTDANNCTVTAVATITQPAAIKDSISKTVNILCFGQSNGQATAGVTGGTAGYTYSWNSAPVQTSATATNLGIGNYTVTITDNNGCKDSAIATITQPTAVQLSASAFPASCNGLCNGQATVIPTGGTSPYTYLWSNGSTNAGATNLCAGTYSVVVTDFNGCTHDTTNLVVTQPTPIVLTKTENAAFCNQADGSGSATVTGGTPPYIYGWNTTPPQTNLNLTNVPPGTYCFGVQDANKCQDSICVIIGNKPGETASIVSVTPTTCNGGTNGSAIGAATGGTKPYTYAWTTGPVQTSDTAKNLSAAIYTLTVTDSAGCKSTAIATINQPALVVTTVSPSPLTICSGGAPGKLTASSTGGNGIYNYIWRMAAGLNDTNTATVLANPTSNTTYTVLTTDSNGCIGAPVPVQVIVDPPLSVVAGTPAATCPGGTVKLTATAKGGNGNYIYTWNPSGTTGQSVTVSPSTSGYYTVIVSDGCTAPDAIDSMEAIIDPLPKVAFMADTLNGCYPVKVLFIDSTTIASGGIQKWTWQFGDSNSYSSNSGASTVDTAFNEYMNPGVYSVTEIVTSDSGCVDSLTKSNMITVYSHPHVSFTSSPQTTTIEQPTITFVDNTTDAYGISTRNWETFGDNLDSTANTKTAIHTYKDTGTFCVKLVDVDKHSCADSATNCVVIDAIFTLYIPNAFTPNGNGLNDVFIPLGSYFTDFKMYIFNRWGQEVYFTNDINKGWNGGYENDNNVGQEDTYVYLISVKDFKGKGHSYMGKVTLIK